MSLPEPYYADNTVNIFHGDCREILPELLGRRDPVDLVLTDPPYGVGYRTTWRPAGDELRDPVANDRDLEVVAEAWPLVMAHLAEDRHWYAFASPRNLLEASEVFRGFKQILAWDKGDQGTAGDLQAGFGECWEAIFYGMKGRRCLNGARPRNIIRKDWAANWDTAHPTVKPVDLLQQLLLWSTDEGEVVLDPFMGSGTTLAAARNLGRFGIGIELEERYCERAAERCAQGRLDL